MIEGFDVSKWQDPNKWDWTGLRGRGVKFMVARASYGRSLADAHFVRYADLVRSNGMVFGAYLFYRQVHSVEEQLALFNQQLERVGGLREGDMFPVLDMENNAPNGDGRVNPSLFSAACLKIADAFREQYGGAVLYYSSYFPDQLSPAHPEWMKGPNLYHWLADYNRDPGKPRTPHTPVWHLHQPKPRTVLEYDRGRTGVDYDVVNPAFADFDQLLIRPFRPDPSADTVSGDVDTNDRPGGADIDRGIDLIREGMDKIQRGLDFLDGTDD